MIVGERHNVTGFVFAKLNLLKANNKEVQEL